MEINLTPEQRAVVASTDPSFVVSAAAGSGKTRVLVERYLKHVREDQMAPDQILTITFTRKAAAEMKRRIVDGLTAFGLREQAQVAETGPIQTIHGFCERMLRENALAAGLDPEFEILSESQTARLLETAVRDALAYPPEDSPEAITVISELAGKRLFGEAESPHARLERAVRDTVQMLRGMGQDVNDLAELHQNPVALLAHWRQRFLDTLDPDIRAAFEADKSGESFGVRIQTAFKTVKRARPSYLAATMDEDLEAAGHTCGLMQIVCHAWRLLEREMRHRQQLDFTALEARAVALVEGEESVGIRLRKQYKVALVDEAQDLNPVQYSLLKALGLECEMLVGDAQQSIYGFRQADVELFKARTTSSVCLPLSKNYRSKDGILAFVDTVFSSLWGERYRPMRLGTGDEEVPLYMPMEGVESWKLRERDNEAVADMIVALAEEVQKGGGGAQDIAILVRKSAFAMDLLRRLEKRGVPARVAGGTERFYTRLEVRDLANALRALSDPYDDFALLAVLRSPFVGLSLDAITLLGSALEDPLADDEKRKKLPVWEALRVMELPLVEDRQKVAEFLLWFEELSRYADRLSAWEVISELFHRTPFLNTLAKRRNSMQLLANVRKLLMLAAQEPDLGPLEYSERIREIQRLRHKEGDAPADDEDAQVVTIMTIHKSKGLEFDVVVVPETHWTPDAKIKDVEVDPWIEVQGTREALVTTGFGTRPSMFHGWLHWRRKQREKEEEWRVMYVALTRAKKRLCVVLNPGGTKARFSEDICKHLGYKDVPPLGLVEREPYREER